MLIRRFIKSDVVAAMLAEIQTRRGTKGLEAGSTYARDLHMNPVVVDLIKLSTVVTLARELLQMVSGPLGYVSLTALTVEPGSKGMPGHVDYPHFHETCLKDTPLVIQFVLSLDGTTDGAAPTWLHHESNIIELSPGDLLAFPGTWKHGVLPNTSNRSRTNLLWSIGPSWIKPMQIGLWNMTIDDVPVKDLITRK